MEYDFIRSFRFNVHGGGCFCLSDFDYITSYINKYPSKNNPPVENSLLFWTMRDINALKRNKTFVEKSSDNTIRIDKQKLDYYAYVDVFKRNLYRLPFYFGNCDVMIDNDLFKRFKDHFITSAIHHHPYLKDHFQINLLGKEQAEAGIDRYFKLLLGEHHV